MVHHWMYSLKGFFFFTPRAGHAPAMEKAGHKLSYWSLYWSLLANQYLFSDFLHRHGGGCSVDTTDREGERTPSVSTMSEGTQGSCWDTSGCLVGTSEATHSSRSNMIIDPPVSEHLSWSYLPFHSDLLICSDLFLLPPNPLPPFSTSVALVQSCPNFACLLNHTLKCKSCLGCTCSVAGWYERELERTEHGAFQEPGGEGGSLWLSHSLPFK